MTTDTVPMTRGWTAVVAVPENASGLAVLRVSGEIEIGNTNEVPHLVLLDSQGGDALVLNLDVTMRMEGPGKLRMHWALASYSQPWPKDGPSHVRLMWMGVEITFLDIEKV